MKMNNKSAKAIQYLRSTIEWDWKFNIGNMKCLELFARTGEWHTQTLFKDSKDVTLLEIDGKYEEKLRSNFPDAEIRITDSVDWSMRILANNKNHQSYDIVSIDNPLGRYGKYCENFEVIENVNNLLADESVLLINIVPRPYGNIERAWQNIRSAFFGIQPFENYINFEKIIETYRRILTKQGLDIKDYEYICREYADDLDYFYYLCLNLKRK